jgi:hypothetical protein
MKLFHAFPRPRRRTSSFRKDGASGSEDEERESGLAVLSLILKHGLLCTPERFGLYANFSTENTSKQECLKENKPYTQIVQSRACFTLSDATELSKEYQVSPILPNDHVTHVDLFGEFAIGLDPIEARKLNIMPVVYYYRHDHQPAASFGLPIGMKKSGLAAQMVERLDELRNLMAVLSYVETAAHPAGGRDWEFPSREWLTQQGIRVIYEEQVERALAGLGTEQAATVYRLFDTDRPPAWNIFDFLQMMLSIYQTSDSTIAEAPLAFFQQREWRLIHHMMQGQIWFSLGKHDEKKNPFAKQFASESREIENHLRNSRDQQAKINWDEYLKHAWVYWGDDQYQFRDYIREIVVPEPYAKRASALLAGLTFRRTPPVITVLPDRWRLVFDSGIPKVERCGKPG